MNSRYVKLSLAALISASIGISPLTVMAADPVPSSPAPVAQSEKATEKTAKKTAKKTANKKAKKDKKTEKKAKKKSQKKAKTPEAATQQ